MQQKCNALTRLESILDKAIAEGERAESAAVVIAQAMELEYSSKIVVEFYHLLNQASAETHKLVGLKKIDRYKSRFSKLTQILVENHLWSTQWFRLADPIEESGMLDTLDRLADAFGRQYSSIHLENDFLNGLRDDLNSILDDIEGSDISSRISRFLRIQIQNILFAIQQYKVDGTKGITTAIQISVNDLIRCESEIDVKDKQSPIYRRFAAFAGALLIYIAPPPTVWDVVGAVPDISEYWRPRIEEFLSGKEELQSTLDKDFTFLDVISKSSDLFSRAPQKTITGSQEPKALPPASDDVEDASDEIVAED